MGLLKWIISILISAVVLILAISVVAAITIFGWVIAPVALGVFLLILIAAGIREAFD